MLGQSDFIRYPTSNQMEKGMELILIRVIQQCFSSFRDNHHSKKDIKNICSNT